MLTVNGYGQTCKIEFYLLKKIVESSDSIGQIKIGDSLHAMRLPGNFHATIENLDDTAFIKDDEIIAFFIKKYTKENKTTEQHFFILSEAAVDRIKKLDIPLCCGKQFALLVEGEFVYGGYFWNYFSSFSCNGIVAFAYNEEIAIRRKLPDYGYENEEAEASDIRKNPVLFDCLKSTNRIE